MGHQSVFAHTTNEREKNHGKESKEISQEEFGVQEEEVIRPDPALLPPVAVNRHRRRRAQASSTPMGALLPWARFFLGWPFGGVAAGDDRRHALGYAMGS